MALPILSWVGRMRQGPGRGGRGPGDEPATGIVCVTQFLPAFVELLPVVAAPRPQGHVDQADQDGHFDQRADHAGQGLAAGDAEDADGDGDGQLEVVARSGERQGGGALIGQAEGAAERNDPTT